MLVRLVGAAAADGLSQLPTLKLEAATPAALRHELRSDEQPAHQCGPEDEGGEDERSGHSPVIGCTRAVD
jgi:hypothetical protein